MRNENPRINAKEKLPLNAADHNFGTAGTDVETPAGYMKSVHGKTWIRQGSVRLAA